MFSNAKSLPRYKKAPKKLDDGSRPHQFPNVKSFYRQQYTECIEILIGEIRRRFSQRDSDHLIAVEELLISSANGQTVHASMDHILQSHGGVDLDLQQLKVQLSMLNNLIKATTNIREVTKIESICDALNQCSINKIMFSEKHKLIRLFLTVPATTATAEISFSTMRRLKTYLRSTMTQKRMNHALLCHAHKSILDNISVADIVNEFVTRNERRQQYFGK